MLNVNSYIAVIVIDLCFHLSIIQVMGLADDVSIPYQLIFITIGKLEELIKDYLKINELTSFKINNVVNLQTDTYIMYLKFMVTIHYCVP